MASDPKSHTLGEVAKHNHKKDCWVIIHGKVYDVTLFLEDHPGGDEVLLGATRKDATSDFEDVGHTDDAKTLMEKYCIGEIDVSTLPAKENYAPSRTAVYNPDRSSDLLTKMLQFLVPLMILGLAFAVRHFTNLN